MKLILGLFLVLILALPAQAQTTLVTVSVVYGTNAWSYPMQGSLRSNYPVPLIVTPYEPSCVIYCTDSNSNLINITYPLNGKTISIDGVFFDSRFQKLDYCGYSFANSFLTLSVLRYNQ